MGEYEDNEEVGAGILRLVAALENEVNAAGQGRQGGSPALCFSCGALTKGSGEVKLLSVKKSEVFLRALLVSQKDEEEILRRMKDLPVGVCGGCDKSLDTLVDLNQQLEDARLEFCGLRRRVGRHMILGSLGRVQQSCSYRNWLVDVESVEDVFPSKAPKRLRRSKDKAIGTDEVVKVEEEECDFEIIAGDVKAETEGGDESLEGTRGNLGGDAATAAGSSRKGASEKDVSLTSIKTCRVMLERICEVPAKNPRPATPGKRRIATNESETKKSSNEQQRTKRMAVNGEGSEGKESPEQATPKQDGTRVDGGSRDLPSTPGRLRRAVAMKNRSSHADGSLKRRSTFTRKPLTISRSVKVPNKTSGGIHYYRRCKFCSKVFSKSNIVRRHCYVAHKAEYMKDLPFVCRVCYNLFPSTNTLEDHKKEHESLRCPTCHEYFRFKVNLKVHMRIHTGEKPFACDVCGQKFSRNDNAQRHMAKHTGVNPSYDPVEKESLRNAI